MPRFHAGFSSGTMVGAGLGVLASRMDVPMPLHLMPVALAVLAVGVAVHAQLRACRRHR
ncbi:MAG: hypothetical protein V9E81_11750 [Marmoricola sp.]